jgi:hypothetical protein
MIGIGGKFGALDVLRRRLRTSGEPRLEALADLIDAHPGYAYFGALGVSLGDFMPVNVDTGGVIGAPGTSAYVQIWKTLLNVFGGDGTPTNPGLKPVLDRIRDLLARLDQIAADEDLEALKGMAGEVDTLNQIASDLNAIIITIKGDGTLSNLGIVPTFADLISKASRPAIIRDRPSGGIGFPGRFWNMRDFLAWRRSGKFAKRLWQAADASGNDTYKAYALGWLSSWSVSASGAAAVASIIGAPYRNQWWRARFVSNYNDVYAYGHGKVGPDVAPYGSWPEMCAEELHKRIEIPGVSHDPKTLMDNLRLNQPLATSLPTGFTDFWTDCYNDVYGDLGTERPKANESILQDAYSMAWLVLWFQTSPESIGCHAHMPPVSPDCGSAPSWTDPTIPGDAGGGVGGPPAPSVDPKVKPENIVCAILLAIVGIVAIATGGWIAGGAAIAGAIALVVSAGTIDWAKFRCDLGWYRIYMYNGLRALHDLMSLGGLVYPYKFELSLDVTAVSLLAALPTEIKTGDNILKSRPKHEGFPVEPWNGSGFSWFEEATGAMENPQTTPALASAYPSGWIDDPANPLGSISAFASWQFPFELDATGGSPIGFINSTDAILDWLRSPNDVPDLNLDGDRGLGFSTWQFVDDEWTNPVNVAPEV